jgi:hypothetical protein
MADIVLFILMGLAMVAAILTQGLLAAAREHVRNHHPAWFDELSEKGSAFRLGGANERARRRLLRPLLMRALPPGPAQDPLLITLSDRIRLALACVALGFGGTILLIALRVHAGVGPA